VKKIVAYDKGISYRLIISGNISYKIIRDVEDLFAMDIKGIIYIKRLREMVGEIEYEVLYRGDRDISDDIAGLIKSKFNAEVKIEEKTIRIKL